MHELHSLQTTEKYDHICDVSKPYGNEHPDLDQQDDCQNYKNMGQNNPDLQASAMIEDILYDSGIKHMNFRS